VRVLARAIGDRMMQPRPRLQGKVVSVLDGIKAAVPGATVNYAQGCDTSCTSTAGFGAAVSAAKASAVTVVVVGEAAADSGEASSRSDISLPGQRIARHAGTQSSRSARHTNQFGTRRCPRRAADTCALGSDQAESPSVTRSQAQRADGSPNRRCLSMASSPRPSGTEWPVLVLSSRLSGAAWCFQVPPASAGR
jgi:hypothetical protein